MKHNVSVWSRAILWVVASGMVVIVMVLGYAGCNEQPSGGGVEFNDMIDLQPPRLETVQVRGTDRVEFCVDEPVSVVEQSLRVSEPLVIDGHRATECGVMIILGVTMIPGEQYTVSMTVVDESGNSLDILTNVYGYNDRVPQVVINEFTTRGSSTHPDVVELYLKSAGNIGGVTLYEGSPQDWESRKVLPALELEAGAYLLLHFKPQGVEVEQDEVISPDASGGLDVHPAAWDFWVPEGNGLSGNNGALTLTAAPTGEIIDAVLYTNRTSDSDSKYRGFGTAQNLARADELHQAGVWRASEAQLRPEDVVFVDHSTATRSICRDSANSDTDGRGDWHIVPTSGYSFGEANSDEVYTR